MPLTPEDVRSKTFTPVRLREGYDMAEVDQFLDEVENELTRLQQQTDELRAQLGSMAPAESSNRSAPDELPVVRTAAEASSAAARLLEIATSNADQLVDEARTDAERILGEARATAERLESESRSRLAELDAQTNDRRAELLGHLEQDKEAIERAVAELRKFEADYRNRLRSYLEGQLRALDGGEVDGADASADGTMALSPFTDGEPPRRLRELLGDEA